MNLCFAEGFFHFICVLATVVLSTKCIYEYFLNENISLVEYQSFQEFGRSGYPSISMCILNPFVKEKLQKHGPGINISSYVMFLNGSLSDESLAAIDYDEVTISLNDFVNWYWIQLSNGTRLHIPLHNYVSLRGDTSKCITVDVPFIKNELLLGFGMIIKNSIFANGKRPKNYHFSKMEGLFIALHYPNQMLIASTPWLYKWKPRLKKDNYIMQFRVKSITVVNRRDQFRSPCIDDRTGYDQYVRNSIMKEQGCKPLYWKSKLDIAECNSEKLKNFTIEKTFMNLHMNKNISWPCNFIEQVDYEYLEDDDPESTAGIYLIITDCYN